MAAMEYKEIHHNSAIYIDSVKINTSLLMMRECKTQQDLWRIAIAHTQAKLPNKSTEAFTERKLNDRHFFHARFISDQTRNLVLNNWSAQAIKS